MKKLKTLRALYLVSLIFVVLSVVLMHTVFKNYTAPENSQSILAPVALIYTDKGTGSGFLSGPSTIITARHVVENLKIGDEVTVSFEKTKPKTECIATLVWKDDSSPFNPEHDFAVLRIKDITPLPNNMPVLSLGSAYDVKESDMIKAIGYPNGMFAVTEGSISNTLIEQDDDEYELLQLDCNIYPGNSGGPIILKKTNEVIGIAISGLTDEFQGINFAAYIDYILDELDGSEIDIYQ